MYTQLTSGFFSFPPLIQIFTLFPYTTLFRSRFNFLCTSFSKPPYEINLFRCKPSSKSLTTCKFLSSSSVMKSVRSEEHTSELQSRGHLVCRLLLEKKKIHYFMSHITIPLTK